jgi:hypothetical protein
MEQPFDDKVLVALAIGFPDQAVCEARIGRTLHAIESKLDPNLASGLNHLGRRERQLRSRHVHSNSSDPGCSRRHPARARPVPTAGEHLSD